MFFRPTRRVYLDRPVPKTTSLGTNLIGGWGWGAVTTVDPETTGGPTGPFDHIPLLSANIGIRI